MNSQAQPLQFNLQRHLLDDGVITEELFSNINNISESEAVPLLISSGAVTEDLICSIYAEKLSLTVWQGDGDICETDLFEDNYLVFNNILPLLIGEQRVYVVADPWDVGLIDIIRRLDKDARVVVGPKSEIEHQLKKHFGFESTEELTETGSFSATHLKDIALEAPIVHQVNDLLNNAVRLGASDIHLEPFRHHIELRYRVDGVLSQRTAPALEDYPAVTSRIKLLAQLDIAEHRLPQDGRIRIHSNGRTVDIRVSTIPTAHGEDIVLRILDKKSNTQKLTETGLSDHVISGLRESLTKRQGIVLVTGPTGSGKTTTLYSALQELVDGKRKIITVEDPVEYEIKGITQISVNDAIGMSFSAALRSILRHDPDVIFIGEIRDLETAEIAIQASLTGHLVISTLHTNSAIGAITRFLDMGIADYLLASSMSAVTAQRLVRKLCDKCKTKTPVPVAMAHRFNIDLDAKVFTPAGCSHCGKSGYKGRVPVSEVKPIDNHVRQAIVDNPSLDNLEKAADRNKAGSMQDDAIAKVLQGETSFEEVLGVI